MTYLSLIDFTGNEKIIVNKIIRTLLYCINITFIILYLLTKV